MGARICWLIFFATVLVTLFCFRSCALLSNHADASEFTYKVYTETLKIPEEPDLLATVYTERVI